MFILGLLGRLLGFAVGWFFLVFAFVLALDLGLSLYTVRVADMAYEYVFTDYDPIQKLLLIALYAAAGHFALCLATHKDK